MVLKSRGAHSIHSGGKAGKAMCPNWLPDQLQRAESTQIFATALMVVIFTDLSHSCLFFWNRPVAQRPFRQFLLVSKTTTPDTCWNCFMYVLLWVGSNISIWYQMDPEGYSSILSCMKAPCAQLLPNKLCASRGGPHNNELTGCHDFYCWHFAT